MAIFSFIDYAFANLPSRLAQQIGQGETSIRSARNLAVLYDSDVFAFLVCDNQIYACQKKIT